MSSQWPDDDRDGLAGRTRYMKPDAALSDLKKRGRGANGMMHVFFVGMNSATMARPPSATSVPSLIAFLQNEWDALMLEVVELKKALDVARQEASHALFQYDGACMMIAKLLKEKDELNEQLQSTKTAQTPHDQETLQ